MEAKAFWEAWRRAEGGLSAQEPTIKIAVELDDVTIDLRPAELATFCRMRTYIDELLRKRAVIIYFGVGTGLTTPPPTS